MSEQGPSDEELLAGCLRKDARSWGLFVERYARLVHWSIRKSLSFDPPGGREEFCREVFQDLFERLLDRNELERLRDAKHLGKFLSVMACHLAIDRHKALSRRAKNSVALEEELLGDDAKDVSEELRGVLENSLSELKPKERACVEFSILENKTAAEIGRLLGMPSDTVSSIVTRAKEKLRDKLKEKGYGA